MSDRRYLGSVTSTHRFKPLNHLGLQRVDMVGLETLLTLYPQIGILVRANPDNSSHKSCYLSFEYILCDYLGFVSEALQSPEQKDESHADIVCYFRCPTILDTQRHQDSRKHSEASRFDISCSSGIDSDEPLSYTLSPALLIVS